MVKMMFEKINFALKALITLGPVRTGLYALYQLGLRSGHYYRVTPASQTPKVDIPTIDYDLFTTPTSEEMRYWLSRGVDHLISEADEIEAGYVRLFAGSPVRLNLEPASAQNHWAQSGMQPPGDIKLVWEPARFGWVYTLGRAFQISADERYAAVFWRNFEVFQAANPVNCGPNWVSAQEVAMRMTALVFGGHVFQNSPESTPKRMTELTTAIIQHARRIPPTMVYARAQNNNHLISEALGLYLAGILLESWPEAAHWRKMGWKWLNWAFQNQINLDGSYIQHSLNYHRLMLHLALVADMAIRRCSLSWPDSTKKKLALATRWYIAMLDPVSGAAPNLGHNDGACLLPLHPGGFRDHRATAQAAALAFFGAPYFQSGSWDELSAWLGLAIKPHALLDLPMDYPGMNRLGNREEWATLRAVKYHSRPAHADQLQVELWHNGENLVLDPGSYSYNLDTPWDNGLISARVHNAPVIDGEEPMQRAGRFLWLSWDQARWITLDSQSDRRILAAERLGYQKIGIRHKRELSWVQEGVWKVVDELGELNKTSLEHELQLNWLLPDGEWSMTDNGFMLSISNLNIHVETHVSVRNQPPMLRLVRAGQVVHGPEGKFPLHGWYSPTYLAKQPALSLLIQTRCAFPVEIITLIQINTPQS
jgi:hypothetical protein